MGSRLDFQQGPNMDNFLAELGTVCKEENRKKEKREFDEYWNQINQLQIGQ